MEDNVIQLRPNDVVDVYEAIEKIEEDLLAIMSSYVDSGLHPAIVTGILQRTAQALSFEIVYDA